MFCPNCGAQIADNAAFCGSCGAAVMQEHQPVLTEKSSGVGPLKAVLESNTHRVTITMVVSLLLILFSILSVFSTAFYKIPFMSMILTLSGERQEVIGGLRQELGERIEFMEDWFEFLEDNVEDYDNRDATKLLKDVEKLRDRMSINSFKSYLKAADKADGDIQEFYYDFVDLSEDDADEVKLALNILQIGVFAFYLLPILFTVLGGIKKSTALTITGMVFTAISQLTISGILWVILSLAVGVYQVMLCNKIKYEKMAA